MIDLVKKNLLKTYYIIGILLWFFIFYILFGSISLVFPYLASHIFCIVVLGINLFLQFFDSKGASKYETEERVYEYVERNTYYLIMAITVFLLIAVNCDTGIFKNSNINFDLIVYSQACAIGICVLIIALYWMPIQGKEARWLNHLRHIKTVFFTYALSLFFIGPAEIIIRLRNSIF